MRLFKNAEKGNMSKTSFDSLKLKIYDKHTIILKLVESGSLKEFGLIFCLNFKINIS